MDAKSPWPYGIGDVTVSKQFTLQTERLTDPPSGRNGHVTVARIAASVGANITFNKRQLRNFDKLQGSYLL